MYYVACGSSTEIFNKAKSGTYVKFMDMIGFEATALQVGNNGRLNALATLTLDLFLKIFSG